MLTGDGGDHEEGKRAVQRQHRSHTTLVACKGHLARILCTPASLNGRLVRLGLTANREQRQQQRQQE